jgi:nucleoredoxin
MAENILGKTLRRGHETITLQNYLSTEGPPDLVGIYFGAHWAPPCRLFTPALAEFYERVNPSSGPKKIEVIFCSNDGNEAAFERNFQTMPFLAVPYTDDQRIQNLKQRYGINGIPTLVVLDFKRNCELISYDGRADLQNHQENALEVWLKKGVEIAHAAHIGGGAGVMTTM